MKNFNDNNNNETLDSEARVTGWEDVMGYAPEIPSKETPPVTLLTTPETTPPETPPTPPTTPDSHSKTFSQMNVENIYDSMNRGETAKDRLANYRAEKAEYDPSQQPGVVSYRDLASREREAGELEWAQKHDDVADNIAKYTPIARYNGKIQNR